MPSDTGVWTPEEATDGHVFSYALARWIGMFLDKNHPVIDLGCGPGWYAGYLQDIGFGSVIGVDGTEIPNAHVDVIVQDLTEPFDLDRKGNVICLEVAEHIPEEYTNQFIQNIKTHLDGVLILSWAIRGQEGLGHVNCLDNFEVIELLEKEGFKLMANPTLEARKVIEHYCSWFSNTIMIFRCT